MPAECPLRLSQLEHGSRSGNIDRYDAGANGSLSRRLQSSCHALPAVQIDYADLIGGVVTKTGWSTVDRGPAYKASGTFHLYALQ